MGGGSYKKPSSNNENKYHHTLQLPLFLLVVKLFVFVNVFVFFVFVDAVLDGEQVPLLDKKPPQASPKRVRFADEKMKEHQEPAEKVPQDNKVCFWFDLVIPVNWRADSTLQGFVRGAIYSRKGPELRYVPPPSSSSHSSSTGGGGGPLAPKLYEIETSNIADAPGAIDKNSNINKAYVYFLSHSIHSDDRADKQMGLQLLSELLHNQEFRQKNHQMEPLIHNIEAKLEKSGLRLPQPLGGHFQLTIFDAKRDEERVTELYPAHLKLFRRTSDTQLGYDKEGKANLIFVRLESVDVKNALKKPAGIKLAEKVAKKNKDVTFWFELVIPVNWREDDTLELFVHRAIYSHKSPELRYIPPPPASSSSHSSSTGRGVPILPKLQGIETHNIAPEETDEHHNINKIFTHFMSFPTHSVDHAEKQMGLQLLSELLHSQEFLHKNQQMEPLIHNIEAKLEKSGLRLPQPLGGHFQLTIFDAKRGEERVTDLFPAHLKLLPRASDSDEDPTLVFVRLESVDVKDALKKSAAIKLADDAKQSPPHPSASSTAAQHKAGGGSSSPRTAVNQRLPHS